MRIHCHFTGSEGWDCERRLIFKGSGNAPQEKPESKKLNESVRNINEKSDVANTVYDFLKKNDPAAATDKIRSTIEEKISKDPEIAKMTVADFKNLTKNIPSDIDGLTDFLFKNGIIDSKQYRAALQEGEQQAAAPAQDASTNKTSDRQNVAVKTAKGSTQSASGTKNSPEGSTSKPQSEPDTESPRSSPSSKTSSFVDTAPTVKDEKYWKERVVRDREQAQQEKRDVADQYRDVTPDNKEQKVAQLREKMEEVQHEMEQLQRERKNAADQKMLNSPSAARRYSGATKQRMGEAYMKYSAQLRDVGERLVALTRQYTLLNEQHMRLSSGKRFGEWRMGKGNDPEYAAKINQQQKRDQMIAKKMDREYDDEKARAARATAEGNRVLAFRNRDPFASYFAGKSAENRARVAGIMGWNPDEMGGSVSGNDARFEGKIQGARDRGMNVVRRGNNYAYIDKNGKVGEFVGGEGGQFSVSGGPAKGPGNAPKKGESKFTKEQNRLKDEYSGRMLDQMLADYKDLADDPKAQEVMRAFSARMKDWAADPGSRYGDLAEVRGKLEVIRNAAKQQERLKGARDKFEERSARMEKGPKSAFKPFILPIDKVNPYLQVAIDIPGSVDQYGKPRRVLFQPNRLEELWGKNDGQILEEAGIWIEKDTWDATGKTRGLIIHFTKEGLYNVNGTPWPVGNEAKKGAEKLRETRNASVINKLDFPIPDGASVIRVLRLPKRTNVDLPIPQDAGVVDGGMGISLIREEGSKNLRLTFSEEGDFQVQGVNTRMEDFRIVMNAIRVSRDSSQKEEVDTRKNAAENSEKKIWIDLYPASVKPEDWNNPKSTPPCYRFGTEFVVVNGERLPVYRRQDETDKILDISKGFVKILRDKQGNPVKVFVVEGPNNGSQKSSPEPKKDLPQKDSGKPKDANDKKNEDEKKQPAPSAAAKLFAKAICVSFPEISEKDVFWVLKWEMGRAYLSGQYYGVDEADFLLDAGRSNSTWEFASAIKDELGISLVPFGKEKMDNIFSLLSIAHDPLALPVIRSLKKSPENIGFSFANRNMLDLEQDRSVISIVSKRLYAEGWRQGSPGLDQRIVKEWVTLRSQQERSFSKSPELDEQQKPKPIDVVVIYDSSTKDYLPGVNATSNAFNIQQGTKPNITKICTNDFSSFHEALNQYELARTNAVKEGRHLVTHVILHGSPQGISVPLKGKSSEKYNADTILNSMNRKGSTVFIASCYGGTHIERREGSAAGAFKDVAVNTRHIVNSLDYNETEFYRIPLAYEKDANGNFNADINKDGKVTLNEVKYWLDISERFHDPMSYDDQGNQITDNRKLDNGTV